MLIGGDRWLPTRECADDKCEMRGWGDDIFARSAVLLLVWMPGKFVRDLKGLGDWGVLETE